MEIKFTLKELFNIRANVTLDGEEKVVQEIKDLIKEHYKGKYKID
jgi:hypothetical protein